MVEEGLQPVAGVGTLLGVAVVRRPGRKVSLFHVSANLLLRVALIFAELTQQNFLLFFAAALFLCGFGFLAFDLSIDLSMMGLLLVLTGPAAGFLRHSMLPFEQFGLSNVLLLMLMVFCGLVILIFNVP